jgi:hypothetical protein
MFRMPKSFPGNGRCVLADIPFVVAPRGFDRRGKKRAGPGPMAVARFAAISAGFGDAYYLVLFVLRVIFPDRPGKRNVLP